MPVALSQIRDLLLPGLWGVSGKYPMIERQWPSIFKQTDSNMALERRTAVRFLGFAQLKQEGAPTSFDNAAGQRYTYNAEHFEIGLGYSITRKAIDGNHYKSEFGPSNDGLMEPFKETTACIPPGTHHRVGKHRGGTTAHPVLLVSGLRPRRYRGAGGVIAAAELILVRHGETAWNREGRLQGHTDIPLSEAGLVQADELAARLGAEDFDALYSSDLLRARQTAERLARCTGHEIVVDPRLRERNLGVLQSFTREENARVHPEVFERYRRGEREPVLRAGDRGADSHRHGTRGTARGNRVPRRGAGRPLPRGGYAALLRAYWTHPACKSKR